MPKCTNIDNIANEMNERRWRSLGHVLRMTRIRLTRVVSHVARSDTSNIS